jgi:hypothetical protein
VPPGAPRAAIRCPAGGSCYHERMIRAAAVAAAVEELEPTTPTEGRAAPSAAPGVEPRRDELAATLEAIRASARRDPHGYLARTVVPEGGE